MPFLDNKTITYTYDDGGNIASRKYWQYSDETPSNLIKSYIYTYDTTWKDKLTSFDEKSITYDAIGNPLTYDGWTYTWEEGRQLASLPGSGYNISYKYNDSGIRTEKTVNGVTTKYHLVGDKVTYETNGTDKIYYTYDANDNLVSMNLNGTEYYYIRNGQNDIIGLIDNNATQVVSYTYDTWEKLVSIDGSLKDTVGVKNPYRYRGYRYDSETGYYYCQSRYYVPEWGRWLNADGVVAQPGKLLNGNVFAYCLNNPVNMADHSGFYADALKGVLVGLGGESIALGVGALGFAGGILCITQTGSSVQTKAKTKTKEKSKSKYYIPVIVGGIVTRGAPIDFATAIDRVLSRKDVYVVSKFAAETLANACMDSIMKKPIGPEIDSGWSVAKNWHYHI